LIFYSVLFYSQSVPEENLPLSQLEGNQTPELSDSEPQPIEVMAVRQLKVLFAWKAAVRPFKKRNKEYWTTVFAILFFEVGNI